MKKYPFLVYNDTLDIERNASTLEGAERWARKQCAEQGGEWIISGENVGDIAVVRRDALDRVWTDVVETSLL